MNNINMKTREIADADLERVSAAGDFGATVVGAAAAVVVSGMVGAGVAGVVASAVTGAAVSDAGSHLEDKFNER